MTDLSILRGKPLKDLSIGGTAVRDLTPIVDCPIEYLDLGDIRPGTDYTPLLRLPKLQTLLVSSRYNLKQLSVLRTHPSLKIISIGYVPQSVEEFWAAYDAQQAAGKK